MNQSNYDKMRDAMRARFLMYDQEAMIQKFSLRADEAFLYIRLLGRVYRIGRTDGVVSRPDGESDFCAADYLESLTIYDVLCCSRPDCCLSGQYATALSLPGVVYTGHTCHAAPGCGTSAAAAAFDRQPQRLADACRMLRGTPETGGDVAFCIPVFDFLPVLLRFYHSDEEFPAGITLLWDTHVLDFLHYESLCYAESLLLRRLRELTERQ